MKLFQHHYGKARIRVMKVLRQGSQHTLKELEVSVMLQGNFESSYAKGDNSLVVPTDTMKNTVNVLAKEKLAEENEPFGLLLGRHFLQKYAQVESAQIELQEHSWSRIQAGGKPHDHSFVESSPARVTAKIICARQGETVESGLKDLLILKTTESAFAGYDKRDPLTTLPETQDRVFATKLKALWLFHKTPSSYRECHQRIVNKMLEVFATHFSPSVQTTLFQMGEAALKIAPEIQKIHLAMPNQHCLLVNLAPFGLENRNELFVPTDEPHGQIEGTLTRD